MTESLESELRFTRELLLWLHGRSLSEFNQRGYWTDEPDENTLIVQCFPPIYDDRQLGKKLPNRDRLKGSFENEFLFLEHLKRWKGTGFPVVHMSWHLAEGALVVSLRHFLFFSDQNGKLRGVGFRLEPPHGGDVAGGGHHDYFHVQMISEFKKGDKQISKILEQPYVVPESQPAFPLPARNSTQLLLALVVGLYGKKMAEQICSIPGLEARSKLEEMGIEFG